MKLLELTLGKKWINQYLSGITLLHMLSGQATSVVPNTSPTLDTLIQVLREVARGSYVPSKYFQPGPAPQISLVDHPPQLASGMDYALISLNASTATSSFVSVDYGGIAYEDPLWVILAAYAISRKLQVALPIATNNDDLWKRVSLVAEAVRQGTYNAQQFLARIEGFIPKDSSPNFELLSVNSRQIVALRDRGLQSLEVAASPKLYELFTPPSR